MLAPILAVGAPEVSVTIANWAENYAGFQIPTSHEPANWKFISHFVYTPFPAEAIGVIGSFMAKAPRLRGIKAKHDPDNAFSLEQSIPPKTQLNPRE